MVKKVAVACLLLALAAFTARADIIYFKGGLKTICQEKTWEEDGQVKCEYGGWIITYQKSDILRILKTTPPGPLLILKKSPTSRKKLNLPKLGPEIPTPSRLKAWLSMTQKDPTGIGLIKAAGTKIIKTPSGRFQINTADRRHGYKPTWGKPMIYQKFIKTCRTGVQQNFPNDCAGC
jgi:hypothetical protein